MIKLASYGKDVILKVFIAGVLMALVAVFVDNMALKLILSLVTVILWLFTLYFFRDPDRDIPKDYSDGWIVSPADGKVVLIEEIENKEDNLFAKGEKLTQVSIFLSPLNVHVNRIPLSGKVTFLKYVKGEYLVAFDHKASERNERSEIGITGSDERFKVLFKQIAGFVARRIVYDINQGSDVTAGERFGMIKFGSRVDILLRGDYSINAKVGQIVRAGESIIARI